MTREEHLLVVLCEECSEVTKNVSKALRFGLDDKAPNQDETNRTKITAELNDIFGIISLLIDEGVLKDSDLAGLEQIEAKKQKVEKYLKYSKSKNRVI